MQKQRPQLKLQVVSDLFSRFTWNIDQHYIFWKSKTMHEVSWEALIARFVPHPAGWGPNSIYTRIKLCEKPFLSLIAWPFSWSLVYCTHSAKLALIDRRIISLRLQQSTHKAKCTLYGRFRSLCFIHMCILEIDRYGFFEADTDISAIHGPIYRPIPIFPKFLNLVFCFIIKDMMYFMPYLFFKTLKIRIYKLEFFKLQQFQYLISLTC